MCSFVLSLHVFNCILWVKWGGVALCLACTDDAAQLTHPRLRTHTQIFCQVSKKNIFEETSYEDAYTYD